MRTLLPEFLALVNQSRADSGDLNKNLKLVDLGCGTGRNTLSLLRLAPQGTGIVGLDASAGMLDVARDVVQKESGDEDVNDNVSLGLYDLLQSPPQPPECSLNADGVVSTLVLEHIPLRTFFEGVSAVVRTGGLVLVSNMHSDMGEVTQAGFVDPQTGMKIRPTSYCHRVEGVVDVAREMGFEIVEVAGERVRERVVEEDLVQGMERARKYVGLKVWFGICFRKLV